MQAAQAGHLPCHAAEPMEILVGGSQTSLKGEDRFHILDVELAGDTVHMIVVADGHGGKEASTHVSSAVLGRVAAAARDGSAEALNEAVVATFKALHEEVRKPASL